MQRLLSPGSGPSDRVQRNGRFRISTYTRTSTGSGTSHTSHFGVTVMLGQALLSLGTDPLASPGGVLTPSVAMGHHLVARLVEQGFEISVQRL